MKQTSHFDIGLDFRMAAHTGIGTYLRGIVEGFKHNQNPLPSQLALFGPELPTSHPFSKVFFDTPIYSIVEQWKYPELVKMCSVWHAPHYNVPLFKGQGKQIVTIHDMIHWVYRDQLSLAKKIYAETMLKRAAKEADHILTVSENSKQDLIRFLRINPEKITVVHNGVDADFSPIEESELESISRQLTQKYRLPSSFFLYVGMLKPHKNVLRLMRTYLKLHSEKKIQSGLVIIGNGEKNSPESKLLADAGSAIVHLPRIDYGDLKKFYNCARALIHPSLYEGFGLTIVEALACGTPVLTTRRASLSEVGGKAVRYMDGEDETEMARIIIEWDQDTDLRSKMSNAGFLQACKFSWDKAARETASVYAKVLKS